MSLIEDAIARQEGRPVAKPIDYARMSRVYPRQKAALTRVMNDWRAVSAPFHPSPGSPLGHEYIEGLRRRVAEKVAVTIKAAVTEWNEIGAWPDGWHAWQNALDDVVGWNRLDIGDL